MQRPRGLCGPTAGRDALKMPECLIVLLRDVVLARHSEQAPSALALCNVATAVEIGHGKVLFELVHKI